MEIDPTTLFMVVLCVLAVAAGIVNSLLLFLWLYVLNRDQDDVKRAQAESKIRSIPALRWAFETTGLPLTEPALSRSVAVGCVVSMVLGSLVVAGGLLLPIAKPPVLHVTLGSLVAIMIAVVLFAVKIFDPLIYGCLESAFALGSCVWSIDAKMKNTLTSEATVTLFASIYLFIRAMDNIKKGLDERKANREELEKEKAAASGTTAVA